jgi:large subunit ribosomal protein L31
MSVKIKKRTNANIEVGEYYPNAEVSCACGATYQAGSTLKVIRVDICGKCHPFFTGENRILDTEGRVEKFKKKYQLKK